jgi:hypothetical protein
VFGFVLPLGMELSHVLLRDEIEIFLVDFLAFRVMIDSGFSVALDDVLPEQTDRLVGDLSLSGTLFRRQQELDGVLGAPGLCTRANANVTSKPNQIQANRQARAE